MDQRKRLVCMVCNAIAILFLVTSGLLLFTTYGSSLKGAFQGQRYIESTELKDEIVSEMEELLDHILVMQYVWEYQEAEDQNSEDSNIEKGISKQKILEFVSEEGEIKRLTVSDMVAIGKGTNGIRILQNAGLLDKEMQCQLNCINWIYGPIYIQKKVPVLSVIQLLNEMYRIYVEAELELERLEKKPSNLMYYIKFKDDVYTNSKSYWDQSISENLNTVYHQNKGLSKLDEILPDSIMYCYVSDKEYVVDLEMEIVYNFLRDYMTRPAFSKLEFIEEFLKDEGIIGESDSIRSYVYGQLDGRLIEFWRGATVGIAFDTELNAEDSYVTFDQRYVICKKWAVFLAVGGCISGAVWLVTLGIILWDNRKFGKKLSAEKKEGSGGMKGLSEIDAAYPEVVWGIALAIFAFSLFLIQIPVRYVSKHYFSIVDVGNIFGYYKIEGFWIYFLYAFLMEIWYLAILRLIRRYQIRKWMGIRFRDTSLTVHFMRFLENVYQNKSVTTQTAIELILFGTANGLNTMLLFGRGGLKEVLFWLNCVIILGLMLFVFLNRSIWQKRISETIQQMTQGDVSIKVDTKDMKGTTLQLAQEVNYLGAGLEKALEEATVNERMKTELLTNVSHDIKTPLTSIVNYVDLLKLTDIPDGKAREYLNILEEKSIRLKRLTEDLVEAARANSGNLALEMVPLDLAEFLQQAIGEMEYKFPGRKLELVVSIPDGPFFIKADGNRLWRVFENLMNNAYKYSMPGTRIYVDCIHREQEISVVIKNISEHPLTASASELTERFVRGDVSRSTEGSGLGLSIARGFVERMGGVLDIQLDGDMFKAIVRFSLMSEADNHPPRLE